jgi:hypothetical protein
VSNTEEEKTEQTKPPHAQGELGITEAIEWDDRADVEERSAEERNDDGYGQQIHRCRSKRLEGMDLRDVEEQLQR